MSVETHEYEIVSKNDKQSRDDVTEPQKARAPKGFGVRHTQTVLLFLCVTVGYALRSNLSVSIVAMTSHGECVNGSDATLNGTIRDIVNCNNATKLNDWSIFRKYDWDKKTQEMIMFSFFVGYTSMQIPMGALAQKYGGKGPILLGLAVNGVLSTATPWIILLGGWMAISVARLLQGMAQAAFYPSIHTLLAKWVPLSERGRLSTYVYTGSQVGTIVTFQVSGLFAGSPTFGWPTTFWFCGLLSGVSFCLMWWLGASSPHDHPSISSEEMTFIMEGGSADVIPKSRRTPWRCILTSPAVWGLTAAHAGSAMCYLLILTQMPAYLNHVLGVAIEKNGILSSLPYLAMYLTALFLGFLADFATKKQLLSLVNVRRLATTTGLAVSGTFLVLFSYFTSIVPAAVCIITTLALHSAVHVGFHINQIDLAPNFAGNIMALGNMLANLASLLVPVVVSNVIKDDMSNQARWQTVFLIFAGLELTATVVYVIFARADVQPWNFHGEVNDAETEDTKVERERKTSVI